ncbi:MAG: NAD-dependent deacylase, partial [Prolixibacteraceae bacterium]|nr:NAD-dependent deacylase [Prolixibacteraceae bacterium]
DFEVHIITQNVDDLHERAGSTRVLHLHGELKKARSSVDEKLIYPIEGWELKMGQTCQKGHQLRPHIVWFGEAVPAIDEALHITQTADIFVVVGTSLNVYPAAGLLNYVRRGVPVFLLDPEPAAVGKHITIIREKAGTGIDRLKAELKKLL